MPPAFNLSQDQTLHLKFSKPKLLSLERAFNPKRSLLTLRFCLTLAYGLSSTARRPHKLPAHTVKDHPRKPLASTLSQRGISPQGAAHLTPVFPNVNHFRKTFQRASRNRRIRNPEWVRAAHCSRSRTPVNRQSHRNQQPLTDRKHRLAPARKC